VQKEYFVLARKAHKNYWVFTDTFKAAGLFDEKEINIQGIHKIRPDV
jgi:hypothetical protein